MIQPLAPSNDQHVAPIIGYHRAALPQKFGVPRQPNLVALISAIEMIAPFDSPAAFAGLEDFSHLWITWQFHHNKSKKQSSIDSNKADYPFRAQVRPPRLGGNQKIGVFASRSMYRPSALGLSVVKLERIEIIAGRVVLMICGADMIDGTPIIDIKPYVSYSDSIEQASSGFATTVPATLSVTITALAHEQLMQIIDFDSHNSSNSLPEAASIHTIQYQLILADIELIKALIAQDPRPAYRQSELHTVFTMRYKSVDVSFTQSKKGWLQILSVVKVI